MQSIERWKPVVGYEGAYEVSDQGRVRSVDRFDRLGRLRPGCALRPNINRYGYPVVCLWLDGMSSKRAVHRLVLESFVGLRAEGFEACHGDGDRSNNILENLRWDTASANAYDRVKHGTNRGLDRTHCPLGHELKTPNIPPSKLAVGRRQCRACASAQAWAKRRGIPPTQEVADMYYRRLLGQD